ncbi:hypothetical protein CHS0354_042080 [Potamilus streckersoni]|uniref:TBC1 domain family member 2B n=1 Tax=Potamilus streckersoni TaxID=2493646 RepID=A0AAE0TNT5_9BIVA|nr:hypothetical protein CHS0354_042080 [Potamilus streckersoni]
MIVQPVKVSFLCQYRMDGGGQPPNELNQTVSPDKTPPLDIVHIRDHASSEEINSDVMIQKDNISEEVKQQTDQEGEIPEDKLCGWLCHRSRGFKLNRQRWCVYGEDTCKLYYYRHPNDLLPVGEINIANAAFYFDASNTERPGLFEIRSEDKEYLLDAQNRHNMMHWLQELQKRRRNFNMSKISLSKDRVGQWTLKKSCALSGLASDSRRYADKQTEMLVKEGSRDSLPRITLPDVTTATANSITPNFTKTSPLWGLNNLKIELQSALSNFKDQLSVPVGNMSRGSSQEDFKFYDNCETICGAEITGQTEIENSLLVESSVAKGSSSEVKTSVEAKGWVRNQDSKQSGKFLLTLKRIGKKMSNAGQENQRPRSNSPTSSSSHVSLSSSSKDIQDLEEELLANREIINFLHKKVDSLSKELESRQVADSANKSDLTEMLVARDKEIVLLNHSIAETKQALEITAEKLRCCEAELQTLRDQVAMYQDMLLAKDEAITKLSNKVFDMEREEEERGAGDRLSRSSQDSLGSLKVSSPVVSDYSYLQLQRHVQELKDMCQAYELQHKFLTKEILEVNDLRKHDEAREKLFLLNYAKLEAKFYQTQSRYLVLLNKMKSPSKVESEHPEGIVSQLLEDAMETNTHDLDILLASSSGHEYDQYGFSRIYMMEEEEEDQDELVTKAAVFERQSQEITSKVKEADLEMSLRIKWENYMVGQKGRSLQKSVELKNLIRQGIPDEYREQVWKGCISYYLGNVTVHYGADYYSELVSKLKSSSSADPSAKQIELDLLRTLPYNKHYETTSSEGIPKLRRVLLAYSIFNPNIGYCQGLNRLAAIALLFLSEEDAFWCIVAIVERILPQDYYSHTMIAAQADQRVLKDLVQDKLPKIHAHLELHGVDLSLFTFNWFLTLFVDNVPPEMFLRVWDTFLFEGSKVLFRFALAFLKKAEEEILRQPDSLSLNRYLRLIGEKMTNVKQISHLAFYWIASFPMRLIVTKRQNHLQQLRLELAELDKKRTALKSSYEPSYLTDYVSDEDLDS